MLNQSETVPLVLVVDDSDVNRKLMETYLSLAQYRVLLASDGPTALQLARAHVPQLILLDVRMPDMDGYAVCQQLKASDETRDIPVIFITADGDANAEKLAFAAGASDFLPKPVKREVTLARVKTHIALYAQRRSLEGMFRNVIEFAPDAFVLTDDQGRIVQMNACAERLFGYARKDVQGVALETLVPNIFASVQSSTECHRKDGSVFPAEVSFTPLQTNRGKLQMAVIRDVSIRKKAESELSESRQQLRELAAKSEEAREAERKHIAREVHDELGQILTALRIDLSVLKIQMGDSNPQWEARLQNMKDLVDQGIHAVRNVAVSLRPAALDMGLVPAIEWLCDHHAQHSSASFEFHSEQEDIDIDEVRAVIIFRIAQESLTNVARYANATVVKVSVARHEDELRLMVQDDGQGFDVDALARRKTFGLLGMRERALAMGGTLEIDSALGQGTRIVVRIPLGTSTERAHP